MLNSSKQVNYNDIYCRNAKLYVGSKLYHYIYGEIEVVNIKRIKTKFEQFNYIECKVCKPNTISNVFMNDYDFRPHQFNDMIITFREDYINEWLSNTFTYMNDIIHNSEKSDKFNHLYVNDIYIERRHE